MLSGSSRRQRRAIDFPAVQPQALLRHPPKIRPADLEAMMVAIALLHPTPDFTRTDRNDDPTDADTTAGLGKLNALSFAGVVVQIAGPRDQFVDQCRPIGKKPFQPDTWQIRAGRKDAVTFKRQQLGFGRRHGAVLDRIGAQPVRLGSDLRRCGDDRMEPTALQDLSRDVFAHRDRPDVEDAVTQHVPEYGKTRLVQIAGS